MTEHHEVPATLTARSLEDLWRERRAREHGGNSLAIGVERGYVVVKAATELRWLALRPDEAVRFAQMLWDKAKAAQEQRPGPLAGG